MEEVICVTEIITEIIMLYIAIAKYIEIPVKFPPIFSGKEKGSITAAFFCWRRRRKM